MNYHKIYEQLVLKRKTQILEKSKELYTENHHIVPKCLGGLDDQNNMVRLTAREHFISHLLLLKMHGTNKLFLAVYLMSNKNKHNSKEYAWLKEFQAEKIQYKKPLLKKQMDKITRECIKHDLKDLHRKSHSTKDITVKQKHNSPETIKLFQQDVLDLMRSFGITVNTNISSIFSSSIDEIVPPTVRTFKDDAMDVMKSFRITFSGPL